MLLLLDEYFHQLGIWALKWPVCHIGMEAFAVLLGMDTKENRFAEVNGNSK